MHCEKKDNLNVACMTHEDLIGAAYWPFSLCRQISGAITGYSGLEARLKPVNLHLALRVPDYVTAFNITCQ